MEDKAAYDDDKAEASDSSSCSRLFLKDNEAGAQKGRSHSHNDEVSLKSQGSHRQRNQTHLDFRTDVLYGRDEEVRMLLDSFERVLNTKEYANMDSKVGCDSESIHRQASAILISGYSGTGKSSLSRHLRGPVEHVGGKFLAGKFDQLQADDGGEPYSAVAFAFDGICKGILNDSAEDINRIREKIVSELGTEAGLLTEILPSLDQIIGEQPAKTTVSGVEAQKRLKFAFRALARSICSPEAPAVVVLDDVQWADEPSLELIQTLLVEEEGPTNKKLNNTLPPSSLLMVLCYRDNEVDMSHPLSFLISDLRSAGVGLTEIKLDNLSRGDTNELISEATRMEKTTCQPLTDIVYRKTQGNCFFVVQFLNSLCRDGLLYRALSGGSVCNINHGENQSDWAWRWNEELISSKDIPDDVVDLMAGRIRKLPPGARDVLQVAACIGSMFDVSILRLVFDTAGERRRSTIGSYAFASLMPRNKRSQSANKDFENSSGENSELLRLLDLIVKEGLIDVILPMERFRFTHDKIQQAAYSLITSKRCASYHYSIGDLIVRTADKAELDRMLFVATDQLNRGKNLISTRTKRADLAALNLRAGKKAMSSAAFSTASKYLRTGIELLGGEQTKWKDTFDLCMRLHNAAAETEYTRGNFTAMEEILAEIFKNARSLDEKLPAHLIYIGSLKARMKVNEALIAGLLLLKQLGEKFPESPGKVSIMSALVKTKCVLRDKSRSDLSILPLMQDKDASAKMLVMDSILQLAFLCRRQLCPLIIFRMIQLSVRLGLHRKSAVAFAAYGMFLCGNLGDVNEGNEFVDLAFSIVARFRANELLAQVSMIAHLFCRHWQNHIKQSLEPLLHGYRTGMQVGLCPSHVVSFQIHCRQFMHVVMLTHNNTKTSTKMYRSGMFTMV